MMDSTNVPFYNIDVPLPKVKADVILNCFEQKKKNGFICKVCSQSVLSASFQGVKLWIHLKSHPQEGNSYVCAIADAITANIPKLSGVDCIKLVALMVDEEEDFNLRFRLWRFFLALSRVGTITNI